MWLASVHFPTAPLTHPRTYSTGVVVMHVLTAAPCTCVNPPPPPRPSCLHRASSLSLCGCVRCCASWTCGMWACTVWAAPRPPPKAPPLSGCPWRAGVGVVGVTAMAVCPPLVPSTPSSRSTPTCCGTPPGASGVPVVVPFFPLCVGCARVGAWLGVLHAGLSSSICVAFDSRPLRCQVHIHTPLPPPPPPHPLCCALRVCQIHWRAVPNLGGRC